MKQSHYNELMKIAADLETEGDSAIAKSLRHAIANHSNASRAMTPESTADAIDAVFRRRLELLIQNLTVSDKGEITWMAISCRGVVQSLYPRNGS